MTNTDGSAALARVEPHYEGITMAMSPAEAHRRMKELQAFIGEVMVEHVDYGMIPGTDKPTLLQPGAQKLAELYGLSHRFEYIEVVRDWTHGFFYFEVRAILTTRRDGTFVGEGLGSCNSKESKYAGRWVASGEIPPALDKSSLQQKPGMQWVFESELPKGTDLTKLQRRERTAKKTGRPYFVYGIDATLFFVPNPDPFSLVNTLIKMACKRAYIHAVIAATRSSGLFTQDVEDLPREAMGEEMPRRPWETASSPEQQQSTPAPAAQKPTDAAAAQVSAPPPTKPMVARCAQRWAELDTAKTIAALKKTWTAIADDRKRGLLTVDQVAELQKVKDARKTGIEKGVSDGAAQKAAEDLEAMGDMPEGWGGEKPKEKEPDDGEPPPDVKLEGDDDDLGGRM